MYHASPVSILLLLIVLTSCSQSENKSHNGRWKGNNLVEFIPDEKRQRNFIDPIDDSINFKRVVDDIFQDQQGKTYVLGSHFNPISKDTLLHLEYFHDITDWFDLKSYKKINGGYTNALFQMNDEVFQWWGNSDGPYAVTYKGADPETFVPFDEICGGKDSLHVFYGGLPGNFKIIEGANPNTIKILNPERGCCNCNNCYFVDEHAVYFGLNKIEGADPTTFRLVNHNTVDAEDKNGKYFDGKLLN